MVNNEFTKTIYPEIGDDEEFRKRYGEQIGVGMTAVIYAHDGIAAKVYRDGQPKYMGFQEAFIQAMVEEMNIPAPRIFGVETFCGRTTVIMEQVKGTSLMDILLENPDKTDECLDTAVELQVAMHEKKIGEFKPFKKGLKNMIDASKDLRPEEKERLYTQLSGLPDGNSICHGDFHCGNIVSDGKSCKIIDWMEISSGSPEADACRSYLDYCIYPKNLEEKFLDKYCAASGRKRQDILIWLPVVAGSLYGFVSSGAKEKIRKFF